ncbi:MAG: ABC transporter ATP-binding protein [Clostridiales bacterium]|nr:ABC transporter ATP-binding protein [Clostridiales bacterium]
MEFQVEGLSKSFGSKEVLRDIHFAFESGRIYGLLGRNGAGKTTFFNCINRDLKVESGSFSISDSMGHRALKTDDVGYVLSAPAVPEFLTGREFLKFFIDINGEAIRDVRLLDEYFDMVSIGADDRDKLMKQYSHGMKNKMQMLVNLILQPNVLLLDEPLTSLDVVVAEEMKQMLRSIKQGCVIILSTHILDLALDLCDEIVLLHHGELERVEKENAVSGELRNKILDTLREEEA